MDQPTPLQQVAKIEISPPRLFTTRAVWIINAFGLSLVLPFLVSVLAVSLLRFGILTVFIPLLCVAASAFYLPFAFGNAFVVKLVRARNKSAGAGLDSFIVQLTLTPKIRSGMRALMEDADDIGYLTLTGSALEFHGDSVKLSVPYEHLGPVRLANIGLRGLWVYGQRIRIPVSGLPNVASLEFAERSSWLLPASWRKTRELFGQLSARMRKS